MSEERVYTVLIDCEAHDALAWHADFLARVSVPAAERLISEVYDDIEQLDHEPYRYQQHINALYPDGHYRCMLTGKRYKVIYEIFEDEHIVHVVNIIDCRRNNAFPEDESKQTKAGR